MESRTGSGELFAVISQHSVLRHSTGTGWDNDGFSRAFRAALDAPGDVLGNLFSLRARSLLHDISPATASSTLLGWLTGADIAAIGPLKGDIVIIANEGHQQTYRTGLSLAGHDARHVDAEEISLDGLSLARALLEDIGS